MQVLQQAGQKQLGLRGLLTDTSTLGGGDRTSNLLIISQPALPPELSRLIPLQSTVAGTTTTTAVCGRVQNNGFESPCPEKTGVLQTTSREVEPPALLR